MRIVNERLLNEFREAGRCEWCGRYCSRREPHHIFAKGMGGGGRLDVRINLIALGSHLLLHPCHDLVHRGQITRDDLLAIVATREGLLQDQIIDEINRLRRTPR